MTAGPALLLLALAAPAAAAPEPPRGPNDSILGSAEEFAVPGPARVCLMQTSVDLRAGETALVDYLGIHHGGFRVVGPAGTFHLLEGNAWVGPRGGRPVADPLGRRVERHREQGRIRYLIYGPARFDRDRERPLVWVDGDALGRSGDLAILVRIDVRQVDPHSCDRRYFYGWDGWGQVGTVREEER